MAIAKRPTRSRTLSGESLEASHRDRAGRKVTAVPMRFPTEILKKVDDARRMDLATISRNTYIIRAVAAKVTHDESAARVKVPNEHKGKGPESKFTLRIPTVLNNRLERALKHLTYQAAKTSRNSYIVGAVEDALEKA